MPRYDYTCPDCALTREVTHSIQETPVVTCEACAAECTREIGTPRLGTIDLHHAVGIRQDGSTVRARLQPFREV